MPADSRTVEEEGVLIDNFRLVRGGKFDEAGLRALLELVTGQERLPVMVQAFLPGVSAGDKRILLVDGEPLGR